MISGMYGLIKHKAIEKAAIQSLNLIIPASGYAVALGIDLTTEVLAPVLCKLLDESLD